MKEICYPAGGEISIGDLVVWFEDQIDWLSGSKHTVTYGKTGTVLALGGRAEFPFGFMHSYPQVQIATTEIKVLEGDPFKIDSRLRTSVPISTRMKDGGIAVPCSTLGAVEIVAVFSKIVDVKPSDLTRICGSGPFDRSAINLGPMEDLAARKDS